MAGQDSKNQRGADSAACPANPFGFVADFARRFKQKFGEPYVVAKGKHCSLFKRLLKIYSPKKLSSFLDYYFNTRSRCKIEFFYTDIPNIIAELKEKEDKKPKESGIFAELEAARKKRGFE